MAPRVKVCCISSVEEARLAISYGAAALGLVGPMPSGPGVISLELIGQISKSLDKHIDSFYLTSKVTADKILDEYKFAQTKTIQLVDNIPIAELITLRTLLPDTVRMVQVLHVRSDAVIQEAMHKQPYVDAFLLDSGNPNSTIKTLGGTGQTHNWNISRILVERVSIPVYLAGGINADNVIEAYAKVQPYGIDLCSGLRTDGKLDETKLKFFIEKINSI